MSKDSTVNLCVLGISEAFDWVNYYALLNKLMIQLLPVKLLSLVENWLLNYHSCIKLESSFSQFFKLKFGVRQGSVLSHLLFAVYVDNLAKFCDCTHRVYLVLYADDILLLSPTVTELQNMLHNCERELDALDCNQDRLLQTTPHDSPMTRVFWRQRSWRNSNRISDKYRWVG